MVGLIEQSNAGAYSASKGGIVAMTNGKAAAFLASSETSFITGVALPVNGAVSLGY